MGNNTISTNMMSLNIANMYNKNVKSLEKSMYAMATGKMINSAADDPAGMGTVKRLDTRIDSVEQANKNLQNDNAVLKIADDGIGNLYDLVSSIREKLVAGSSSSATAKEREQLAADIDQMITDYDDMASDIKYGGKSLVSTKNASSTYAGSTKGYYVQYGADAGDNMTLLFDDLKASKVSLTSAKITAKLKVSGSTGSVISADISNVDTVLNKLNTARAKIGNYERRLGFEQDNRTSESSALIQLRSSIRDTDTAKGMTNFMTANITTQASQLMLAQAGQIPSMVLQLLQS